MPDAPGPGVQVTRDLGTDIQQVGCLSPITDGHGDWIGVGLAPGRHHYDFVSAVAPGEPAGSLEVVPPSYAGDAIAPQPDGYLAVDSLTGPGLLRRYDAKGAPAGAAVAGSVGAIQGVPGGGAVLLATEPLASAGGRSAWRLVWVDAAGETLGTETLFAPPLFAVSAAGNVLVFAHGEARWYGRKGAPITDWFGGIDAASWWNPADVMVRAAALADGSVVVGLGGDHALRFEGGSTAFGSPPAWITARAGATIAAVRGGRANAFATVASQRPTGCEIDLELLTPAGESCGTTRLEAPWPCTGVAFGADRTVFTMGSGFTGPGRGVCGWHWWSGLLR